MWLLIVVGLLVIGITVLFFVNQSMALPVVTRRGWVRVPPHGQKRIASGKSRSVNGVVKACMAAKGRSFNWNSQTGRYEVFSLWLMSRVQPAPDVAPKAPGTFDWESTKWLTGNLQKDHLGAIPPSRSCDSVKDQLRLYGLDPDGKTARTYDGVYTFPPKDALDQGIIESGDTRGEKSGKRDSHYYKTDKIAEDLYGGALAGASKDKVREAKGKVTSAYVDHELEDRIKAAGGAAPVGTDAAGNIVLAQEIRDCEDFTEAPPNDVLYHGCDENTGELYRDATRTTLDKFDPNF